MLIKKLAAMSFVLACVITYVYSAVDVRTGRPFAIDIDLSKPLAVVWPVEVSMVGEMGEKGLRIGPRVGQGWRGEIGGQASYRFYVPEDGKYSIWAYCLWFDECANAIYVKVDDLDKAIVGNDPVYKQWHWVRGFNVKLKAGTHTLVLSNHSDHISVQNVFLTNSDSILPEDNSVVFSDIFYDGFDGCDQGNFANWEVISGKWIVQDPEKAMCLEENALIGKSEDSAMVMYTSEDWSGYAFNLAVRPLVSEDKRGSVSICFGVRDSEQYHELAWQVPEENNACKMSIRKTKDKTTEVIATFGCPWKIAKWHHVEIMVASDRIVVRVDDERVFEGPVDYQIVGGIGLRLEGNAEAYFDDIHVRTIINNEEK